MSKRANNRPAVDFIGIGMGKAGTTWLWEALRRHPQVFLPERKELQYFNRYLSEDPTAENPNFRRPVAWYEAHFADAGPDLVRGEFSPVYWRNPNAAEAIHAYNPAAKLIATLRAPEEHIVSAYLWRTRRGVIPPLPFEQALERYEVFWDNVRYYANLRPYLDLFPLEQLLLVTFDEIKHQPSATLGRVHDWLGVERRAQDVPGVANAAAAAARPKVARLFRQVRVAARKWGLEDAVQAMGDFGPAKAVRRFAERTVPLETRPEISPAIRRRIREVTRPELEALGKALGRDFSAWYGE